MKDLTLKQIIELGSGQAETKDTVSWKERKDLQIEFQTRLKTALIQFLLDEGIYNPKVNFYDVYFYKSTVLGKLNVTNNLGAVNKTTKVLNKIQYNFFRKSCPLIICKTDINFNKDFANKIATFINNALETL